MNLGEKLRVLRQDQNLTQPQLADAIGIEQSYLSKLENGKYVPSSDVFRQMLEVFDLSVRDFVDDLDHRSRLQLLQIPEVANHFNNQKQLIIGNRRRWLVFSAALLALGAALAYGGTMKLFIPAMVHQYKSHGIVLESEPKELFSILDSSCAGGGCDPRNALEESGRIQEDYLTTRFYRGAIFNVPVDGGSRTYYRLNSETVDSWINNAAAILGILLVMLGITGFVFEKKLSYYQ